MTITVEIDVKLEYIEISEDRIHASFANKTQFTPLQKDAALAALEIEKMPIETWINAWIRYILKINELEDNQSNRLAVMAAIRHNVYALRFMFFLA